MNLPSNIKDWLNQRGITDAVLNHNGIDYRNDRIVIPVFDSKGRFLFDKYRRSPFSEEGPKYTYDKGATAALYNTNNLWIPDGPVVIVEGELDALRLQSGGYLAVSTTGGSGTFKKEWAELLAGHEIYVCYDNDEAGIAGSIRLLEIFPDARIIEIPREHAVKDVTDYLQKHEPEEFVALFNAALAWGIPQGEGKLYAEALKLRCEEIADLMRERVRDNQPLEFPSALLKSLQAKWDVAKRKRAKRPVIKDTDALRRARAVPITEYVKTNNMGFALCVAHAEKTPSMKYYKKNNHVKCFGCGFNGDTIDVVAKMFNLTVGQAIKKINGTV